MAPDFIIRPAEPVDLPELYQVCLATGNAGGDVSNLHDDKNLLGHVFVGPYVSLEPHLAFVLEDDSSVCGYVLGALDTVDFFKRYVSEWLPQLQARVPQPDRPWEAMLPSDRLRWRIHHPSLVFPDALKPFPSHLHIDLLPRAQGHGRGRAMLEVLLESLVRKGSRGVHLEMDQANERAEGFYRHMGFLPVRSEELPTQSLYFAKRLAPPVDAH